MTRIMDLLQAPIPPAADHVAIRDPFVDDDILAECELQQVRFEVVSGTLWVLFDLRGSLFFDRGNTAVLTAVGVESVDWSGRRHDYADSWLALPVGSSAFAHDGRARSARIGMIRGEVLTIRADVFRFVVGDVPGCDDPQPSFADDDPGVIRRGLASWESPFTPIASASTGG